VTVKRALSAAPDTASDKTEKGFIVVALSCATAKSKAISMPSTIPVITDNDLMSRIDITPVAALEIQDKLPPIKRPYLFDDTEEMNLTITLFLSLLKTVRYQKVLLLLALTGKGLQ
jgi:hypothetical protein